MDSRSQRKRRKLGTLGTCNKDSHQESRTRKNVDVYFGIDVEDVCLSVCTLQPARYAVQGDIAARWARRIQDFLSFYFLSSLCCCQQSWSGNWMDLALIVSCVFSCLFLSFPFLYYVTPAYYLEMIAICYKAIRPRCELQNLEFSEHVRQTICVFWTYSCEM